MTTFPIEIIPICTFIDKMNTVYGQNLSRRVSRISQVINAQSKMNNVIIVIKHKY